MKVTFVFVRVVDNKTKVDKDEDWIEEASLPLQQQLANLQLCFSLTRIKN
jgi:hypothetical protein